MSTRKQSTCAAYLDNDLLELHRREELECLRPFVINEQCFMATKDAETAAITMEELKKLARAWKLHERRNFWKIHSTRDLMVGVLRQHIIDTGMHPPAHKNKEKENKQPHPKYPVPPVEIKPSTKRVQMRNYCGIPYYFNKEGDPKELISTSRFLESPVVQDSPANRVVAWRTDDFYSLRAETPGGGGNSLDNKGGNSSGTAVPEIVTMSVEDEDNAIRLLKQRNLSVHLVQYSANMENNAAEPLTAKSIQVFLSISETADIQTVCNCVTAVSNICSIAHVRSILLEMNAVHKIAAMIPLVRGTKPLWSAGLLFYYFSLERDIEDRIYNASFALLQNNGASDDYALRMLSLYTLSNLLPCIERQRVSELLVAIFAPFFSSAQGGILKEHGVILDILMNICSFTNTHSTLMEVDVLDMLSMLAAAASSKQDVFIGRKLVRVLGTFMHSTELAEHYVSADFISIFIDLLSIHDMEIIQYCFRIMALMSSVELLADSVSESDVVQVVCEVITNCQDPRQTAGDKDRLLLTFEAALEAARYFSNICQPRSLEYNRRLKNDGAAGAIIHLLTMSSSPLVPDMKSNSELQATVSLMINTSLHSLQNLLLHNDNCNDLMSVALEPLCYLLQLEYAAQSAACCIFNLSCVPSCEAVLVQEQVHSRVLNCMKNSKETKARTSFVQILVQLAHNEKCVSDLLQDNVVKKLNDEVKLVVDSSQSSIWLDISLMLLALVANKSDLLETHRNGIIEILVKICTESASEAVVINCAKVLAFLTLDVCDFLLIDPVITAIFDMPDNESVMSSLSFVLYNISCVPEYALQLLTHGGGRYLNVMIRMMRNGNPHIQENIAEAMRTLCSLPKGAQLLLDLDLLSDFIVIALLRTSSEDIKSVCSESFFNLLCHVDYRQKLLKGDLWWAMMRLSRSSSLGNVRMICARTLFNLACDRKNMKPLRENSVLSLVKDISSTGTAEFLEICLKAIQNIVSQFDSGLSGLEVLAVLRICADVLSRCVKVSSIHAALRLLLRCSLTCATESIIEFVTVDMASIINETRPKWSVDPACCHLVTHLLFSICRCLEYTKAVHLVDIKDILSSAYECAVEKAPQNTLVSDVCEDITGIILYYIQRHQATANVIITQMSVWKSILLRNPFSANDAENNTSLKLKASSLSILSYVFDELVCQTQQAVVSESEEPYSEEFESTADTTDPAVSSHLGPLASNSLQLIPDMLSDELLLSSECQENLMSVIMKCSLFEELAALLVKSNISQLFFVWMEQFCVAHKETGDAIALANTLSGATAAQVALLAQQETQIFEQAEFCSCVLRNLSLHRNILGLLVNSPQLDALIHLIVDCQKPSSQVYMNVLSVLYFSAKELLLHDRAPLSPKVVLGVITKIIDISTMHSNLTNPTSVLKAATHLMMATSFEAQETNFEIKSAPRFSVIVRVAKHIVGIVLDKYSMGSGVHPSYVQSMFLEMNDPSSADIPVIMESLTVTQDWSSVMEGGVKNKKKFTSTSSRHGAQRVVGVHDIFIPEGAFVQLDSACTTVTSSDMTAGTEWATIICNEKKTMGNDFYSRTQAQPVTSLLMESLEPPASQEFTKIVKVYACVTLED